MSLILAIEPNKSQAQQLGTLVRTHLKAELVTAASVTSGLGSLADRIPDLILTPALFGMRDESALTEYLRQLGNRASHVQTLAIPILAAATARGSSGGILGRKKGDSDVGCDPAVFAEQIRIYLQRATVERRAQASEASARAMTAPPPFPSRGTASEAADDSSFFVAADEFDMESLEIPELSVSAVDPPPATEKAPRAATSVTEEKGERKSGFTPGPQKAPSPLEAELGLVAPPAAGPPLWRVTESIEDFYGGVDVVPEPQADSVSPRPAPVTEAASITAPNPAPVARPAPRPRRTPSQPDDWSFFDPSQSAFKALIKRLDEIAGNAA